VDVSVGNRKIVYGRDRKETMVLKTHRCSLNKYGEPITRQDYIMWNYYSRCCPGI